MSIDDPALAFFHEIVEPTVQDFLAKPDDKRLGVLAALALASMTEHFFRARPELGRRKSDLDAFKLAIRDAGKLGGNAAIGWIADVANATKHVLPSAKRIGYEGINVLQMNQMGLMRAGWPMGGEEVLVGDLPSSPWRLSDLVKAAIIFWQEKLRLDV